MTWLRWLDTFLQHGLTGPGGTATWNQWRQQRRERRRWGRGFGPGNAGWGMRPRLGLFGRLRRLLRTVFWVFFGLSFAFVPEFREWLLGLPGLLIEMVRSVWRGVL